MVRKAKLVVGIDEAGRAVSKRRALSRSRLIIGVDEAGRGPLAGPMVIGAVGGISPRALFGIRDSKKLTEKAREKWYRMLRKNAICHFVAIPASHIDRYGLSLVTKKAIARLLKKFSKTPKLVLLDGGIYAPSKYTQRTIIKGDEKIPLIAAASIIAKVSRDRTMKRLDKKYPRYGFARHKGYGTKAHMSAIRKYGFSRIHRRSFCTRIV